MKLYLKWVLICWVVLFCLSLDHPFEIIPAIGHYIAPLILQVEAPLKIVLDGVAWQNGLNSDSPDLILHTLCIVLLSCVIAWYLKRYSGLGEPFTDSLLWRLCTYVLSFFLLYYGMMKILRVQFPEPEPNILFSRVNQLDGDMLFWTVMGKSWTYSFFCGFIELVPAILLWFQSTRRIGALVAWPVLMHVLVINMAYGIEVKLFSTFLILLNTLLIIAYRRSLWAFVSGKESSATEQFVSLRVPERIKKALKVSVILMFVLESCSPVLVQGIWHGDQASETTYQGAWEVLSHQTEVGKHYALKRPVRRLFVHRMGYLILQTNDEQMHSFVLRADLKAHLLKVNHPEVLLRMNWVNNTIAHATLITSNESISFEIKRIQ